MAAFKRECAAAMEEISDSTFYKLLAEILAKRHCKDMGCVQCVSLGATAATAHSTQARTQY